MLNTILMASALCFRIVTTCTIVCGCATGESNRYYTKDKDSSDLTADSSSYSDAYLEAAVIPETGTDEDAVVDSPWCGGEVKPAELIPIDLYIMLDSSASMGRKIDSSLTKWKAVTGSINSFVSDSKTPNLYLGLQFFPFLQPSVPAICSTDNDCNNFGPCTQLKLCQNFYGAGKLQLCLTDDDCTDGSNTGTCHPQGTCSNDSTKVCLPEYSITCPNELGDCKEEPKFCKDRQSCNIADYATATVPIGPRATVRDSIVKAMENRELYGATPTGPALQGSVDYVQQYLKANPMHQAAVLLVTDGLPTDCSPTDPGKIAKIAAQAAQLDPPIITYVIGVFEEENAAIAQSNLNAIAAAGKTSNAYIIKTTQDVAQEFSKSLEKIREHRVACEYAIPTPTEGDLSYDLVNVELSPGDGTSQAIGNVPNKEACAKGGWYYDVDPKQGTSPTKIMLCPNTCKTVQGKEKASVAIRLGCPTIVIK